MTRSLAIGASGAVFGVLAAYGVLFARRRITLLVMFVLPVSMEARVMVLLFAGLEMIMGVSGSTRVAHVAHLGGMLAGWDLPEVPATADAPVAQRTKLADRLRRAARPAQRPARSRTSGRPAGQGQTASGIHTLTPGEREFLDRVSRRVGHEGPRRWPGRISCRRTAAGRS